MESIWSRTVEIPERECLKEDIRVDAVVIGAGMSGLLTAFLLEESGLKTVVLEAGRIAGGQTKNTTAKITSQHGMIYKKLTEDFGEKRAALYGQAHEAAIGELERLIKDNHINCHFSRLPGYLYSQKDRKALEEEAWAAEKLGLGAFFTEETGLPFETAGAVRFENQAQFHPLEFIKAISGGLSIYEHTRVRKVRRNKVYTDKGRVTADHIIFACHYPIVNVPGFYFLRQHQEKSCVIAWDNVKPLPGIYYSIDKEGLSLRSSGNILLTGGGGFRTGEKAEREIYTSIRKEAERFFPEGREITHWSAQDCMPHDGMAFIGQYSIFKPGWHVATGFQKWGMTSSMLSAMLIRDEIWGIENPYALLFSPQRFHPTVSAGPFFQDAAQSMKGLAKGIVLLGKKEGKHRRCTHMGCALNWNEEEEIWECPCHGSCFDKEGKLLTEPSKKDLKE